MAIAQGCFGQYPVSGALDKSLYSEESVGEMDKHNIGRRIDR
jgi:hypothetical protein